MVCKQGKPEILAWYTNTSIKHQIFLRYNGVDWVICILYIYTYLPAQAADRIQQTNGTMQVFIALKEGFLESAGTVRKDMQFMLINII